MGNLFELADKTIVVFGGGGYIGRPLVSQLLAHGGRVLVADLDERAFDSPEMEAVRGNPGFSFIKASVESTDDIVAAYNACVQRFGSFNTMINLAAYGKLGSLQSQKDEDMAYTWDGVAGQVFRSVRETIPFFEKDGGTIVTTASMYGIVSPDYRIYGTSGQNNPPMYGMGKAAVIQLTRYAAAHMAPYGVRVNCVAPGPVPSPANNPPADFMKELAGKTMLGRVARPEEMAGAYIYLVSQASSFTTGECVVVDGGWTQW